MSREAMKQKPVAWMHNFITNNVITHIPADIGRHPERWTPLYTAPPKKEWVGLTDEEILECTIAAERNYAKHMQATRGQQLDQRDQLDWWIARCIEAKLKEKNGGEYRNGATTERTKLKEKNQ